MPIKLFVVLKYKTQTRSQDLALGSDNIWNVSQQSGILKNGTRTEFDSHSMFIRTHIQNKHMRHEYLNATFSMECVEIRKKKFHFIPVTILNRRRSNCIFTNNRFRCNPLVVFSCCYLQRATKCAYRVRLCTGCQHCICSVTAFYHVSFAAARMPQIQTARSKQKRLQFQFRLDRRCVRTSMRKWWAEQPFQNHCCAFVLKSRCFCVSRKIVNNCMDCNYVNEKMFIFIQIG